MSVHHDRPFRPWTGYGLVFALLVATFIWTAVSDGRADEVGRVVLSAAMLLLALRAAGIRRRVISLVGMLAGLGVLAAIGAALGGNSLGDGIVRLINLAILTGLPVAVAIDIRRTRGMTPHLIMGLLCIYLLIGIFFSGLYGTLDHYRDAQFFAETADPDAVDFLYFSFVTLTTVGYGDLTAADDLGRTLSMIEALTGQLYLVTVVALGVANIGATRRARAEAEVPRRE
jgi:Ion channel